MRPVYMCLRGDRHPRETCRVFRLQSGSDIMKVVTSKYCRLHKTYITVVPVMDLNNYSEMIRSKIVVNLINTWWMLTRLTSAMAITESIAVTSQYHEYLLCSKAGLTSYRSFQGQYHNMELCSKNRNWLNIISCNSTHSKIIK